MYKKKRLKVDHGRTEAYFINEKILIKQCLRYNTSFEDEDPRHRNAIMITKKDLKELLNNYK